jgi:hypothetical protein
MFCFEALFQIVLLKYGYCFMTQLTHCFIPCITKEIFVCPFFIKRTAFITDFAFFRRVYGVTKVGNLYIYCCKDKIEINQINEKSTERIFTAHAY